MGKFSYEILRSRRKTMALEISFKGILVRAPLSAKTEEIEFFVEKNRSWIEKHLANLCEKKKTMEKEMEKIPPLTKADLLRLTEEAKAVIPERAAFYARKAGVSFDKITIRCQKTRWGSCSSKKHLSFNCLLMLFPLDVIDSVVVHEICHLKEMNHSKAFYREVEKLYPDYWRCHQILKEKGSLILARKETP